MEVENLIEEVKFYIMNRRYGEAERLLKDALKEHPDNEELLYNLGLVYELQSEGRKAVDVYRKIVESLPAGRRREDALRRLRKLEGYF